MERIKTILRRWHWLHTWTKWEEYGRGYFEKGDSYITVKRVCTQCGEPQLLEVRE